MLTSNGLTLLHAWTFPSLDPVARTLLPGLVSYALRSSAVLFAAWIIALLLRRSAAATRHAVWAVAVATVAALPLLSHATPAIAVPIRALPSIAPAAAVHPAASATHAVERAVSGTSAPSVSRRARTTVQASASRPPSRVEDARAPMDLALLVVAAWLLGAICLGGRWAIGTIVLWRRAMAAEPVSDAAWVMLARDVARELSIRRPVMLLMTDVPSIPVTGGIIYPILLLPLQAAAWSPARRRAVLLHELAHVARFDAATQLLGQVVLAAMWFNPLVWLAVRRMRVERERACDDVVLRRGTQPSTYAEDLLTIVRTLQTSGEPGFAALAMARHAELEGRLRFILDAKRRRATPSRRRSMLSLAAAAPFVILVAAVHPSARAVPRPATSIAQQVGSGATPARVPLVPRSLAAVRSAGHGSAPPATLSHASHATSDGPTGVPLSVVVSRPATPIVAQPASPASTRCPVQTEFAHGGVSAEVGEVAALELENNQDRVLALASDGRCVTARLDGWVILSDDERDVTGLGSDAHVIVRDSVDGHVRAVLISRVKAVRHAQGQPGAANKPVAAASADNEPLYVVDGFIVNGTPLAANPRVDMSSGYPVLVTSINPDDIERLDTKNDWIIQKDDQVYRDLARQKDSPGYYIQGASGRAAAPDSIGIGSDSVRLESNSVGGAMAYQYFVDGEARSWTEGAAWFHATLAELLRETGYDAASRVAFLRDHGGVPAVLDEIRRLRSDVGLRAYFDALLASGNLSPDDAAHALSMAQSVLTDKSDKDRILSQLRALDRPSK